MALRTLMAIVAFATLAAAAISTPAHAGCGCEKPPPALAEVRPHAAYVGTEVRLFHPDLQPGGTYTVVFTASTTGESAAVQGSAVTWRDLADGEYKPQIVVSLPDLPLGPTGISVTAAGQSDPLVVIDDAAFTVIPQPVALPLEAGEYRLPDFQAAVGRDGTVYLSLDLSDIKHPRTFKVQALGYPLVFMSDGVMFYNTQGVLMQVLGEDMPGLFSLASSNSTTDSDILGYSRHEFNTWYLQHFERQPHSLDPEDPNWHEDGTPHVDHDHLIVAIEGILNDGTLPVPGATPPAELVLSASTFFHRGLVGDASVKMKEDATTDSYDSTTGTFGSKGDIASNGKVTIKGDVTINGDVAASKIKLKGDADLTGEVTKAEESGEFLPVDIPDIVENLGSLFLSGNEVFTLGPGTYEVSKLQVTEDAVLYIDNLEGPVTVYTSGPVEMQGNAAIVTSDPNPEKFAIYVGSDDKVKMEDTTLFYGLLYAPESSLELKEDAEFFGSFVGRKVQLTDSVLVHYDTALRGDDN